MNNVNRIWFIHRVHFGWSARMSNVNPPLLSLLLSSQLYFLEAVKLTTQLHNSIISVLISPRSQWLKEKRGRRNLWLNVHYLWIFLKGCLVHNLIQHKPGYVLNKIHFFVNCSATSHQQVFDTADCNVTLSHYNIKLPCLLLELSWKPVTKHARSAFSHSIFAKISSTNEWQ